MISLTSGVPGAGKTLWTVAHVEAMRIKEGREVFYHGIKDLKLDWRELEDPKKWHECPAGAIIVIDEAQYHFPTRGAGQAVPEHVAKLAVHRHQGHDLFIITQHPGKLDSSLRKDTEVHRHLMRKFGSSWSTVHQWQGVRENCDKTRKDSISTQWRFPKAMFGVYHSAEVHTHKVRIPLKLWALLLVPVIVGFAVYRVWLRTEPAPVATKPATSAVSAPAGAAPAGTRAPGSMADTGNFDLASFKPRIEGLPFTAPRYDGLTSPVRAPVIVGCVLYPNDGICFTQQGTRVKPPLKFIRDFVANGFFVDFEAGQSDSGGRGAARAQVTGQQGAQLAPAQQ